jgi:hypothetical protein
MTMTFKERYTATPVGTNATVAITGSQTGGFLAVTAGTITLADLDGNVELNAFPVAAGQYVPLPILLNTLGGTFTAAGGASGTLLT